MSGPADQPVLSHALIIAQREALSAAQSRVTAAESEAQHRALLIEKLKYTIRKLRHERFGQSSERGALLDQLELQLADLEEDAAQAEATARLAATVAPKMCLHVSQNPSEWLHALVPESATRGNSFG